ncbi:biotin--protein ligase [Castellaniella sp.]|uniref:biotin--protein ligase n=1 Tax=Castellaniella sp. TaxID=1955812 RepID=UPI003561E89B
MAEASGSRFHGEYKIPGGKLVVVDLQVLDGRLHGVRISGDFFLEPPEALDAINQALNGLPADTAPKRVAECVLAALPAGAEMFGLSAQGIAEVVRRAVS